jgi:tRNA A-37 threonylcarbamoyl transferase component Bud32
MPAPEKLSKRFLNTAATTLHTTLSATKLAPGLVRKPRLVHRWLLTAHWAQLILLCALLLMPSLVPEWIDSIREGAAAPPTTTEKLQHFFNQLTARQNPETYQEVSRTALWGGSAVIVLFAFFLQLPRAVSTASLAAQREEKQADRLNRRDPSQSLFLYRSALALTLDPQQEAKLQNKIASIKKPPASNIEKTVIIHNTGDNAGRHIIAERYRPTNEIGRGAMGIIYQAHDTLLERDVALKQLAPHLAHDPEFTERFVREARALAKLSHPNIVQVFDFINADSGIWIAMELVNGEELEHKLAPDTPLAMKTCIKLGIQLSNAMDYAHGNGVIHRDFKPANVLVTATGDTKIMDFGLARIAQSSKHTHEGTVMGSVAYMSPEQASGKDTAPATDIYAFGVTLYRMTTGKLPFNGDPQSIVAQHLSQTPVAPQQHNTGIPDELNTLIMQMLAKAPGERPSSMLKIMKQLQRIPVIDS